MFSSTAAAAVTVRSVPHYRVAGRGPGTVAHYGAHLQKQIATTVAVAVAVADLKLKRNNYCNPRPSCNLVTWPRTEMIKIYMYIALRLGHLPFVYLWRAIYIFGPKEGAAGHAYNMRKNIMLALMAFWRAWAWFHIIFMWFRFLLVLKLTHSINMTTNLIHPHSPSSKTRIQQLSNDVGGNIISNSIAISLKMDKWWQISCDSINSVFPEFCPVRIVSGNVTITLFRGRLF